LISTRSQTGQAVETADRLVNQHNESRLCLLPSRHFERKLPTASIISNNTDVHCLQLDSECLSDPCQSLCLLPFGSPLLHLAMPFYGEGMNLDDIDDEQVWISPPFDAKNALHSGLADFEQTLRCPICCELLHVPVSIQPCQHSFCSECIQSHVKAGLASLKREAKCPVCRQVVPRDMKCLVPNRTVETLVRQFKGLRNALKEALVTSCCQVKVNEGRTCCCELNARDENGATTADSAPNSKRCRTTRSDMASPPAPNGAAPIAATDPPPQGVAAVEVTELRKKLPNTHYKGMNRSKLAELCRNDGLSTNGDAAVLKARHQAFVSLYNAECDSFTPRSAQQIVQEINRREIAIKVNTGYTPLGLDGICLAIMCVVTFFFKLRRKNGIP
jgi:hypothetical protein